MNNFVDTALNAGLPAIYIVVSTLVLVMYVIRQSVTRAILKNIIAYIVINAVILVMCVIRQSVIWTS